MEATSVHLGDEDADDALERVVLRVVHVGVVLFSALLSLTLLLLLVLARPEVLVVHAARDLGLNPVVPLTNSEKSMAPKRQAKLRSSRSDDLKSEKNSFTMSGTVIPGMENSMETTQMWK